MKFQKEIKAGIIAVVAIALLILGINFLKGSSFFGGDDTYHSYFENTNQLMVASDVAVESQNADKELTMLSTEIIILCNFCAIGSAYSFT